MGNIIQCCHTLSDYFKCNDVPIRSEAERSPLLSSEESECDSSILPDNLEDDMLTVSTGVTNPALEPENFLFPDIILSSNLGGDVALVEPMVCLLVSEEEEGGGERVRVGEGLERGNRGRNRDYSEVETQTEVETQIGMGVQTQTGFQTEVQTQTEMLVPRNESVKREVNTLINTGIAKEMVGNIWQGDGTLKQVDMLLEATTSHKIHSDNQSLFAELEVPGKVEKQTKQERNTLVYTGVTEEGKADEKQKTIQENVFKLQQSAVAIQENIEFAYNEHRTLQTQEEVKQREQNIESEHASVMLTEHDVNNMDGNIGAVENNTGIVENLGPTVDLTQQSIQNNEQMEQETVASHQNVNEKDRNNIHKNLSADQIESEKNLHPKKREEDHDTPGLQHVLELHTALPQVEKEEAEMKNVTLLLVDRLFLAAPHVKGVCLSSMFLCMFCHIQRCP